MTSSLGSQRQSEEDGTDPGRKLHALLVEDMPIMVKILGRTLDQLGISYHHVANGQLAVEAFECAEPDHYDMVFMDIMMPVMNGVEATRRIRAHEKKTGREKKAGGRAIPIIAVSTKMSDADTGTYCDAGMTDCIKKPVDKISLETLLGRCLPDLSAPEVETGEKYDVLSDEMEFVNWSTLQEYGALFKSGLYGLIRDYLMAAPGLLELLHDAVKGRKADHIHMYASQLKSASAVFGADRVSHLAAMLEILACKQRLDETQSLYLDLHIAFEHTRSALAKKMVVLKNLS